MNVTTDFVKALPKVELHAHLTGSISRECLHEIWLSKGGEEGCGLGDPLAEIPGVVDVVSFFPVFDKYIYSLVSDIESIQYATTSVLRDFANDGVRYLELRTTPRAIPNLGVTKETYVSTVLDTISAFDSFSKKFDSERLEMRTRLILSVDRKNTIEEAEEVVSLALAFHHRGVVGVDLCGNPARRPISHLAPAFKRAGDLKLNVTLHFAEIEQDGLDELRTMLSWQPQRLGHVIHVPEELRKEIKRRRLGLELCLSCNVQAGLSKGGFGDHHFGEWWGEDCPIALSTDDVGIFQSPLSNEYLLAALHFQLDRSQLVRLGRSATSAIFGTKEDKEWLNGLYDVFETGHRLSTRS